MLKYEDIDYRIDPRSQPHNRGYFDMQPMEKKMQNYFDLNFDLYKNIDKIKYTDKKIETSEFLRKQKEIYEKETLAKREVYKKHGYKFIPHSSFSSGT